MMATLKKALTEALRHGAGTAARRAARGARGQAARLWQVQGNHRRLTRSADGRRGASPAALAEHVPTRSRRSRVALSGGIDSMVLLDALARARRAASASPLSAIHVNHGLSPQCGSLGGVLRRAMRGARHCRSRCIDSRSRASAAPASRPSPATRATSGCSRRGVDVDRAGAPCRRPGRDGAAATAARRRPARPGRDAGAIGRPPALLRPLARSARARRSRLRADARTRLDRRREQCQYALTRATCCATTSRRFSPRILPGYPRTLARAARASGRSGELLDELARTTRRARSTRTGSTARDSARCPPLARGNLLRWFLRAQGLRSPSKARLADMLRQLVAPRPMLACASRTTARRSAAIAGASSCSARRRRQRSCCIWHGEPEVALPGGALAFEQEQGNGLAARSWRASGHAALTRRRRTPAAGGQSARDAQ